MTTTDCTCELYGYCAACERPPEPRRMTDDQLLAWADQIAKAGDEEACREAAEILIERFTDDEIPLLSIQHKIVRDAMDAPPGTLFPEQYLDPDNPSRLSAEGSRLFVETLGAW